MIGNDLITINYNHRKTISANDFFQAKMAVDRDYKVAGRKFEIFFEKDDNVFCGKRLSGDRDIKLDTLFSIAKDDLITTFPDYHLDGYQVRNIVYSYLKENIMGYGVLAGKNKFKYSIDKSLVKIVYEQMTNKYILSKSTKYYFKLDTKNMKIVDFTKL
ncbi:hypothetical protein [Chryseobacterium sp. NKUCC03_KSP]|uniref:hypothetical protein n=1 Tax=Chryseobacterium sp. NKUCC03_KSP TaxID=2842125 RepID=UPI001C5AE5DA|nr:hypothetical protein [Chryseobacterium sp. NKUCC03_KSP]MBW3522880.1 hypothetical protein [Chryseobacterium sp. NKUCC03_KSP]